MEKFLPEIEDYLQSRTKEGVEIYPNGRVFHAFDQHELDDLKVVILGQDPYHTPGVATGLSFTVGKKGYCPPSLRSILEEMEEDLGPHPEIAKAISKKDYRDIWGESLAQQGVLLLNTALTVERGKPNSHQKLWEEFTSAVVEKLLKEKSEIVWILWGTHAIDKVEQFQDLENYKNNYILKSSHPVPMAANRPIKSRDAIAFKGSRVFTIANKLLKEPIQWIKKS